MAIFSEHKQSSRQRFKDPEAKTDMISLKISRGPCGVARILLVDEQTIDKVFGREDSNRDQNMSDSEIGEELGDVSEEENDVEDKSEEDNWVVGSHKPARLDFTDDQGLNTELPDNPSFLDHFYLPFPENLFEEMARQMNKYAREIIASVREGDCLSQNSRFRSWPEDGVTPGEMKAFLAMIITMGLVNQENIQDYWSTDEVLSDPFFPQITSRDTLNTLSFFHFVDDDNYVPRGQAGYNPLYKLGITYSIVTEKFLKRF